MMLFPDGDKVDDQFRHSFELFDKDNLEINRRFSERTARSCDNDVQKWRTFCGRCSRMWLIVIGILKVSIYHGTNVTWLFCV